MLGEDDDGDRSWAAVSKRTKHDGPAPAAGVGVEANVGVAAGEMAMEGEGASAKAADTAAIE